jgi:hypothetical protein
MTGACDLPHLMAELRRLARMGPIERARAARLLSDRAMAVLAAVGDEAVYQATRRPGRHDEVAAALGVSVSATEKAVRRHNAARRKSPLTEGAESDTGKPARRTKHA